MEKAINQIKMAAAGLLGLLTGLWGWFGWLVVGWIGCMALDYLTGSMAAAKAGDWSSGKAREGIWHKCGMIVVVVVAAGADLLLSVVLANLPLVELPVPKWLTKLLALSKGAVDGAGDKLGGGEHE